MKIPRKVKVFQLSDEDIGELISNDDDHFSTSNVKRDDSLKRVRFYESIEIREFTPSPVDAASEQKKWRYFFYLAYLPRWVKSWSY